MYCSQDPIRLESGEPNFYSYVRDSNSWIDVFGLDCSKKGVAKINYFEYLDPKGKLQKHFSIDVASKGGKKHTHQVIFNEKKGTTIIDYDGNLGKPKKTISIDLPNSKAAIDYQKSITQTDTGIYDASKNSCLTHVMDVIRSGGIENAPTNSRAAAVYLMKL